MIRSRKSKDKQYNGQKKTDKQRFKNITHQGKDLATNTIGVLVS